MIPKDMINQFHFPIFYKCLLSRYFKNTVKNTIAKSIAEYYAHFIFYVSHIIETLSVFILLKSIVTLVNNLKKSFRAKVMNERFKFSRR